MLRNSFYQFQADRAIPDLEKEIKVLEEERDSMKIEEEDSLKNHYNLIQQYKSLKKEVRDIVTSPKYCIPSMKYGKVLCIQCTDEGKSPSFSIEDPITWGILVDFHRVKSNHDEKDNPSFISCLEQVSCLSIACLNIEKDLLPLEAGRSVLVPSLMCLNDHLSPLSVIIILNVIYFPLMPSRVSSCPIVEEVPSSVPPAFVTLPLGLQSRRCFSPSNLNSIGSSPAHRIPPVNSW
ncbi:hypothetical protein SLEP1_g47649 [Rubroshorea leprosula]|uniref:Exosome RNA helicase MTR4-like stalk domain-containing protein n=1 Tax=Rubroshorea leprosula TaxID=152421 RepID=A0AAV5LU10_9ROSI|nr:hypothetical protein SLEP1_g47649 [Rubroshorea leprosula]